MGAVVQLSAASIPLEPGRQATMAVQVRNTGTVVDRFSFDALGPGAEWVAFSPETLSLFPGSSGTVNILVSAPREPSTLAGPMPLGIKVSSSEDADGTVVEEATMQIAAFSDVALELMPRVLRARKWGRSRIAVDNRSNVAYRGELEAGDPRGALGFCFRPTVLDVAPGEASFASMTVNPKKVFWRGPSQTLPFSVLLRSDAADAPHPPDLSSDGSLVQDALLPRWLLVAIAALVALLALLVLLWFTVLRPQVRSTAKDQVNKQLAAAGLVTSPSSGSGAKPASTGAGAVPGKTTTPTTAPVVVSSSSSASGQSVNGSTQASGNGTQVLFTIPVGDSLQVTDLLVENSAGDTGTLTLARNGVPLMQWALANFRDLDYHWITPTVFGPGTQMQMVVSGCPNACTPGVYFAGNLNKAS